MKVKIGGLLLGITLLTGCSQPQAGGGGGGTIEAINHTKWAISQFSVNGQSGIDSIGPFQGGGGGCCFGAPAQWTPGMMVRVDWESGVGSASDVPEIPRPKQPDTSGMGKEARDRAWEGYTQKKREWFQKIKAMNKTHSQTVPVPDYTGHDTCGIVVHFLPCDQVKVTTSCARYGYPDYPLNLPLRMKEPKVCPK